MIKKVYKQVFFSVITKNVKWEISTKNLVNFKDGVELRMKNLSIRGFH